jgi:hypothetical protein
MLRTVENGEGVCRKMKAATGYAARGGAASKVPVASAMLLARIVMAKLLSPGAPEI